MLGAIKRSIQRRLLEHFQREKFVVEQLGRLAPGAKLLDAGCGSQQYRKHCGHLRYFAQDFGKVGADEKPGMTAATGYEYGPLDYVGDIWSIQEQDGFFDAILCTEVFEHIPYPIRTVEEFARLLRPGGKLILTAPAACLRHMDPFFYYAGFSDRFFEKVLADHGLRIETLKPVGDYYAWVATELMRTAAAHSFFAKLVLAPAFAYYLFKKPTEASVNTLCFGYHIVAERAA